MPTTGSVDAPDRDQRPWFTPVHWGEYVFVTPAAAPIPQSSRERVLAVLRASETPLGVAAVTAATGLSANAVRFHLQNLMDSGAVRAALDPDHAGPGRPRIEYAANPLEGANPASAYRLLAGLLATALHRSAGPDAASDAGRHWARSLPPANWSEVSADPIDSVATLFANSGFDPRRVSDRQTLELHKCPFLDLAVEQPDVVCGIHLGLVQGLLEELGARRDVQLVPVLDGSGPCLVRLSETRTQRRARGASITSTEERSP
jgi:predicted ArsR family transcriptional regulator